MWGKIYSKTFLSQKDEWGYKFEIRWTTAAGFSEIATQL